MKHLQLFLAVALILAVRALAAGQAPAIESIKLWDPSNGKARDLSFESEDITSLAFSSNSPLLAAGSATGVINLWNLDTAKKIGRLVGHSGAVQALSFSPDGRLLASGSWDRTIRLWNATTRRQVASLNGNDAEVLSVAFSPTGKYLAGGGGDDKVRLWNLATKRIAHTLVGHTKKINSVAFSFDGKFLATGVTIRPLECGTLKPASCSPALKVMRARFNPWHSILSTTLWPVQAVAKRIAA